MSRSSSTIQTLPSKVVGACCDCWPLVSGSGFSWVLSEEQEHILAQGFDGLLLKPFKEADLLRLLGISPLPQRQRNNHAEVSAIRHIALDDEEQVRNIIAQFLRDTASDITTLKAHYRNGDIADVELLLHRIAGRTAQVGGDEIAFRFRKMEIDGVHS